MKHTTDELFELIGKQFDFYTLDHSNDEFVIGEPNWNGRENVASGKTINEALEKFYQWLVKEGKL